jgi:hypothetical protein
VSAEPGKLHGQGACARSDVENAQTSRRPDRR